MGLLAGKNALIFGVANERSIAWGITRHFTLKCPDWVKLCGEVLEKRVHSLAQTIDCYFVEPCDVSKTRKFKAWQAKP